nr:hypothetical protein pmam_187 [Pithovirus mammoth]
MESRVQPTFRSSYPQNDQLSTGRIGSMNNTSQRSRKSSTVCKNGTIENPFSNSSSPDCIQTPQTFKVVNSGPGTVTFSRLSSSGAAVPSSFSSGSVDFLTTVPQNSFKTSSAQNHPKVIYYLSRLNENNFDDSEGQNGFERYPYSLSMFDCHTCQVSANGSYNSNHGHPGYHLQLFQNGRKIADFTPNSRPVILSTVPGGILLLKIISPSSGTSPHFSLPDQISPVRPPANNFPEEIEPGQGLPEPLVPQIPSQPIGNGTPINGGNGTPINGISPINGGNGTPINGISPINGGNGTPNNGGNGELPFQPVLPPTPQGQPEGVPFDQPFAQPASTLDQNISTFDQGIRQMNEQLTAMNGSFGTSIQAFSNEVSALTEETSKRNTLWLWIAIGIGAIFVLLVIGFLVYFLMKGRKNKVVVPTASGIMVGETVDVDT